MKTWFSKKMSFPCILLILMFCARPVQAVMVRPELSLPNPLQSRVCRIVTKEGRWTSAILIDSSTLLTVWHLFDEENWDGDENFKVYCPGLGSRPMKLKSDIVRPCYFSKMFYNKRLSPDMAVVKLPKKVPITGPELIVASNRRELRNFWKGHDLLFASGYGADSDEPHQQPLTIQLSSGHQWLPKVARRHLETAGSLHCPVPGDCGSGVIMRSGGQFVLLGIMSDGRFNLDSMKEWTALSGREFATKRDRVEDTPVLEVDLVTKRSPFGCYSLGKIPTKAGRCQVLFNLDTRNPELERRAARMDLQHNTRLYRGQEIR